MMTPMEMNNIELLQHFEQGTLRPEDYNHEVMLRIAWILIQKYGIEVGTEKNCELKKAYFENVLKNDKFNLTLTKAYSEILYHFMQQSSAEDFDTLLLEFPRLRYSFKQLVKTHYGYDILKEHRKEEPKQARPILFTF